jgi:hypothetical protein
MQNLGHVSTETKGTPGSATEQGAIVGFDPR